MYFSLMLLLLSLIFPFASFAKLCTGHFINPLTDVCWRCLFPLSIGHASIVQDSLPDTENAVSAIGMCPSSLGFRVGLNIGFWEPFAVTDVTDTPYCMVNLGGTKLNLGLKHKRGGRHVVGNGQMRAFFHVHWYKYPLINWLNLITSSGCLQPGDFDIAYLSELDPTWRDSEMSLVLNPEAALFGNVAALSACAADSTSSTFANRPMDSLYWCAGALGSYFPLTGHVTAPLSPIQTALLLTERLNFKLHREPPFIIDSSPKPGEICREHHYPILPKSRYRYELVNQVADGRHCYPSGHSTLSWEAQKIKPHTPDQYGFLVWRKRNCTFY